nr:hypothetical protein Iba_chr15fCG0660 [Ipomoea batatas]
MMVAVVIAVAMTTEPTGTIPPQSLNINVTQDMELPQAFRGIPRRPSTPATLHPGSSPISEGASPSTIHLQLKLTRERRLLRRLKEVMANEVPSSVPVCQGSWAVEATPK